jgi:hypothetical protein
VLLLKLLRLLILILVLLIKLLQWLLVLANVETATLPCAVAKAAAVTYSVPGLLLKLLQRLLLFLDLLLKLLLCLLFLLLFLQQLQCQLLQCQLLQCQLLQCQLLQCQLLQWRPLFFLCAEAPQSLFPFLELKLQCRFAAVSFALVGSVVLVLLPVLLPWQLCQLLQSA